MGRVHPTIRVLLPVTLFPLPLIVASITAPEAVPKLLLFTSIMVFAIDAGVIAGLANDLIWWTVLLSAVYMEFMIIVFLISNLELLRRWRPAGRFFGRQERRAEKLYHRRTWLRRFHFWGVVVITFLPLGSGVVLGTFLAKFTGMGDRRAIAAVYFGTVLWVGFLTLVFGLSIDEIKRWIEAVPGES